MPMLRLTVNAVEHTSQPVRTPSRPVLPPGLLSPTWCGLLWAAVYWPSLPVSLTKVAV